MIVNRGTGEVLSDHPAVIAEIQELIPPLRESEHEQLKANILSEGIRDPLVVWRERGAILDGHNRLGIAKNHGLDYQIVTVSLPGLEAAKRWVILNQLGRRNLTPQQSAYLRGKLYAEEKKSPHEAGSMKGKSSGHFVQSLHTADRIAAETGVSSKTVRRDADYAEAVDSIANVAGPEARDAILGADVRLTKKDAVELAGAASDNPDIIKEVAEGKRSPASAKREIQKRQRASAPEPEPPTGKYRVLYADPPWQYSNSGFNQSAESHYPTMSQRELCALPIRDLAMDHSVLFLWATSPLIPEALEVMKAWGFEYKASRVWIKDRAPGIGWFIRTRHELLLIGVRGSGMHPSEKLDSIIEAGVTRHSAKPHGVYADIERCYEGPYIELFARNEREGWQAWGNEIG